MYANDDIYTGSTDPTNKINPKIIGAFYINTKTAKLFVCTDNTINNNTWKICNPDIKIPEIPPPTPMVFTTCKHYTLSDGPYKHNIAYTNTYNVPMCIIYYSTNYSFYDNDAVLYINDHQITNHDDWENCVTAIIAPGVTFKFSSHTNVISTLEYFIIK